MNEGNNNRILIVLLPIFMVVLLFVVFFFKNASNDNDTTITPTQSPTEAMSPTPTPTPPIEMFLKQDQTYDAILHTTEGDIKIKLFQNEVPVAANNFAMLVRDGFYNGLTFHRVVEGFMIQGGDPNGDGTGDPGYSFADEAITRDYTRGTIAYANSGPNTNGSQFFIMHQDYGLAKNYVIFGEVTEGMDVVDKIATAETKYDDFGYEKSVPIDPVTITSAELVEE